MVLGLEDIGFYQMLYLLFRCGGGLLFRCMCMGVCVVYVLFFRTAVGQSVQQVLGVCGVHFVSAPFS